MGRPAPIETSESGGVRQRSFEEYVVWAVFLLVPLTFYGGTILGIRPGGVAWLTLLGLALVSCLIRTPAPRALGYLFPYICFLFYALGSLAWTPSPFEALRLLAQLATPALVYLMAWTALGRNSGAMLALARRLCIAWIVVAFLFGLPFRAGLLTTASLGVRPLSITLVLLFVVATMRNTSPRMTILLGLSCIGCLLLLGSRTATLALLVMLVTAPSLAPPRRWLPRMLTVLIVLVSVWLGSTTTAFQERFFFQEEGTLTDIVTLNENVDTAGRRENWAGLRQACAPAELQGFGIGASELLILEASGGRASQPHNDFLRLVCDTGLLGSVLFWGFFLLAGGRAWISYRAAQDRPTSGAALQLIAALVLFGLTDNVLVYTAHYMAPMAVILAASDRGFALDSGRRLRALSARPRTTAESSTGGEKIIGSDSHALRGEA